MTPVILNEWMYERGRGPELRNTRITVYDLIPYLLAPGYSDEKMYEAWPSVTPDGLAALKAYIAEHLYELLVKHHQIDERIAREMAAQDTPEFRARSWMNRERMTQYRAWLAGYKAALGGVMPMDDGAPTTRRLQFQEWCEAMESLAATRSAAGP